MIGSGLRREAGVDLEDRLINLAVQICVLTDRFPSTQIAKHVAAQVIRSGTSPFANFGEAQAAESRQDCVHKLKVCLKELRETQAWLQVHPTNESLLRERRDGQSGG